MRRPPIIRARFGRFVPGIHASPATEIAPGQRLSPRTEFAPGQTAHNHLPIGAVRVRRETHTGLLRAWVKTAEPNHWRKRAVVVWETQNGRPLPAGCVVHHNDRNSLNDAPDNLVCLTRQNHIAEHHGEVLAARRSA